MKKVIKNRIGKLLIVISIIAISISICKHLFKEEEKIPVKIIREPSKEEIDLLKWQTMIQALIIHESEGNPMAVGPTKDVGILQITPIYVKQVNKILGEPRFNLAHRLNVESSLEMFEIYQSHFNPEKDIKKAIRLHNPGADSSYFNQVYELYNTLLEYNQG